MRIAIINKSDSTGGAAVVCRRLLDAFRKENINADMLVVEKLTDSPYIHIAGSSKAIKFSFLLERLKIFIKNGFNRETLFKIDTGSDGLPLWNHPLVKSADAILINWVNQGMLSLKGVEKILALGKPVIWTMHDMWCMTGVCHHAGSCEGFLEKCSNCPLFASAESVWKRKRSVYNCLLDKHESGKNLAFVAVSNWLADKAAASALLKNERVLVIPNAFDMNREIASVVERKEDDKIRILFGAARIDDPIKGFPILTETLRFIKDRYPDVAAGIELITFGSVKEKTVLDDIAVSHHHLGMVKGDSAIRKVYENADILVSSSSYETLPGTLVEAQAYGCIPVSFDRGGQRDIVEHLNTGFIAELQDERSRSVENLAKGILWAISIVKDIPRLNDMKQKMRLNVEQKFSASAVARSYLSLIESMCS